MKQTSASVRAAALSHPRHTTRLTECNMFLRFYLKIYSIVVAMGFIYNMLITIMLIIWGRGDSKCLKNLAGSGKWNFLTIWSFCRHCYMRDVEWSWKKILIWTEWFLEMSKFVEWQNSTPHFAFSLEEVKY